MDVVAAFVADAESAELVQPADGAFHDPAMLAQAAAMRSVALRQNRLDATFSQAATMRLGVVRAVALHALRLAARASWFAAHWGNRFHQRFELRDIVRVGAGQRGGERNAVGVGDQMMLAASFAAIRGVSARFFPPCSARTEEESTIARDQSIKSASRRCASNAACSFFHTPRFCQARKRRQAVMPDPQPSSFGNNSQGVPVRSTNRIAESALRLSIGLRPGNRLRRRFGGGNNGSINAHNASSKIGFAISTPPCAPTRLTKMERIP